MDCSKQLRNPQAEEQQIHQWQTKSELSAYSVHDQSRRSANYKPNIWKYDFLESLNSKFDGECYLIQMQKLIKDVKKLFVECKESDVIAKLELIDSIRKVGLNNHFEQEIKAALDAIASAELENNSNPCISSEGDLYAAALFFKILRQQGYQVSQDIFGRFMDEMGTLKKSTSGNVKGMIELLEASNLAFEGEDILEKAQAFLIATLRDTNTMWDEIDSSISKHVTCSLELSSQRRVQWFNVKWHIKAYEKNRTNQPYMTTLLELAKLNFNEVQATLQKDLREASKWWYNLGLTKNLDFARDRMVECFMCAVGLAFETDHKSFRKWLTKVINLILIIDDVYDVYGSLEELKHFTRAVERWDVMETEQLPECMKICFQVLYNTTCEIANETEEENGWNQVLPQLCKVWADFCKALLVEAEWYNEAYTPSFEEYLSNGYISSSASLIFTHAFFATKHEEGVDDSLHMNEDLVYNISVILRLLNDLGTSAAEQERGDAASSILCYKREMNVSEEIARKNIKSMIDNAWKKINENCLTRNPKISSSYINITTNIARVGHILYQDGDGFGDQEQGTRALIQSLLVEPLS
ncbi:PREDICTED: (E,E)-alpha-farnesene synthase-like isoform X2 [Fragaria vesca subsp. vesca]|uniref:(E,E)-alpha-farnesene synthase-like isoform X2 n=1 Tax=Fragaria vesca subsp. vesca TaxID=101020 RepID=UPI0002C36C1E|nr:PREDICTED: (E,E)-alpha-farnesene synthase-like isoform X2 [Fragaria vesca subsp. vesca]